MKKKYYRLLIVFIFLFILAHSGFSYYGIGSCSIYDIKAYDIFMCNFNFLVKILIIATLVILNEIFIYKITRNSFPRWLIVSVFFLAIGSGLISLFIWLIDKYGYLSGGAGVVMLGIVIFTSSTAMLIFASIYLFRLLVQRLFANFFHRSYYFILRVVDRVTFFVLERYFYSGIIIAISISILLYIVTFISLASV